MSEASIHRQAALGFHRAGADYERGRPGYPEAAVSAMATELGIGPGRTVIDLAAGTGKLTRALSVTGARLVAVEPVAGMRAQLIEAVPGVKALDGTAEDIPLPDGAADAVAVAQAFHWFDTPRAAAEIHRVLAPGGGLGVIWNAWDESVPWVARTQAIVHEFQGDAPRHATSRWRSELDASGLFTLLAEHQFDNLVPGDPELLEARVSSTSYIAALGPTEREAVLRRVRQVLEDDPVTSGQPQLEMPYHTHLVCLAGVTPRQKTVAEHVYPNTGCKEKL